MPGLALLKWFSGTKPPNPQLKGRGGRKRRLAAPGGATTAAADPSAPAPGDGPAPTGDAAAAQPGPHARHLHLFLGPLSRLHLVMRAVAAPSAHLAARLLSRPWQPIQEAMQEQLARMEAVKETCAALKVDSLHDLQDVLSSLILAECVYKVLDTEHQQRAVGAINGLRSIFPPQLVGLRRVQWAMPHAPHSFLMAESNDALYVAFMGTKRPRDLVTNVTLFQDQILFDAAASGGGEGSGDVPAAHKGFSSRAKSIPIEALYHQARSQGKRLVLCGHSLGGAVAQLCTIRLLQQLPPSAVDTVSCIGFATPPLANQALADLVKQNGWDKRLISYMLPEDPIPGLLASRRPPPSSSEGSKAEAEVPQLPEVAPSAALASVSMHSDALAPQRRPRLRLVPSLPQLGRPFWGQEEAVPRSVSVRATATAQATAARGAREEGAVVVARSSAAAAGEQGMANNIASARQLGLSRVGRISKHIVPQRVHSGASKQGDAEAEAEALVSAGQGAEELAGLASNTSSGEGAGDRDGKAVPSLDTCEARDGAVVAEEVTVDEGGSQQQRRRRWMVPRPPLQAMAQSAQAAARLMAAPLTAAAALPVRVTPQYVSLGKTLYVLPDAVTTSRPTQSSKAGGSVLPRSRSTGALAAAGSEMQDAGPPSAAALAVPVPQFGKAASSPALQLGTATMEKSSGDEGNLEEEEAAALAAIVSAQAIPGQPPMELPPRTLFPMHRMLSYRNRILGVCKVALKGRVWLPALPHFPNVPHPDDVALTELLAPGLYPLKAEGVAVLKGQPAAHTPPAGPAPAAGAAPAPTPARRPRRRWGVLRLFRRAGAGTEGPPVEVEVRVEGRGLHTVTSVWIEGAVQAQGRGDSAGTTPAQIVWQPLPPLPASVVGHPMQAITPVTSFFSWLAVSMGWVALLRRLQPAGKQDYLVARVTLPASLVQEAQLAASNPIQAAVNDAHLPGVHVGPKLIMHLQSDFARTSVPLDIRAAADMNAQLAPRGWRRVFTRKWWE